MNVTGTLRVPPANGRRSVPDTLGASMLKSVCFLVVTCTCCAAAAHDVPSRLPDPLSVAEAWNVLEGSKANVDVLVAGNLLRDMMYQIANSDRSLRYLAVHASDLAEPERTRVPKLCEELLSAGSDIIAAIRDPKQAENVKSRWADYRKKLGELESAYPPATLRAAVYICPMHPLDRHLSDGDKCTVCSMGLIKRHLPASSVYEKPGEPTMTMTVAGGPLVVGRPAQLKIRLAKNDRAKSAVLLSDLVEMHTKKIHLLINDGSLSDYHHEHPTPTGVPGEYEFGITPAKPGPYRVWADLVPAASSIQEYVTADIPAETASEPLTDRRTISTLVVNGRTYTLDLQTGGKPIRVGQTVVGTIAVADASGKPFVGLEPVTGTFAHIVGFDEDRKTILHIHPYGKEPTSDADRAGPAFAFKFYAPAPGFFRLYGQVQIGGVNQFAPFGVTVLPAAGGAAAKR